MAHLYKMSEWQSGSGQWYVNDIEEPGSLASQWWIPVRMLNISVDEYFYLLKDTFQVNMCHYNKQNNVLIFSFSNQQSARKFKNWINQKARLANYII